MAPPTRPRDLEVVFGRAFLMELERGNVERAQVFARAFLSQHAEDLAAS